MTGSIITIDGIEVGPIFGGTSPQTPQYGAAVRAEALRVVSLADGTDLDVVWQEFQDMLDIWNSERTRITDLLCFNTTLQSEPIPNTLNPSRFEEASEFGVPKSANVPGDALIVGYKWKWTDLAGRFSWKFLQSADRRQVEGMMNAVLAADNAQVTGTILRSLLVNKRDKNEIGVPVYNLYDGAFPGPPPYLGRTFDVSTNHYVATGASVIDSDDIESAIRQIRLKGYGMQDGSAILILANPDEGEQIMGWRAGHESRPKEGSETSGPLAKYDFIPAIDQPPWITPMGDLIGVQVPGEWNGVKVWGSYGPALLMQSDFIPSGYVAVVASYGKNSMLNAVGFRQHPNPAYQGLRHLAGSGPYPLVESFSNRGFGTGVRQRGAAVALQVTTDATYTSPTEDQIPV